MSFKSFVVTMLLVVIVAATSVLADEGMWPMSSLNRLPFKTLKEMGLELGAKDIYNPKGGGIARAVVSLGGGTGSFVSPKGLILTNHHVAFGALQRVSSTEHNYIEEGFWAKSYEEELPAPGYRAYVLLSIKDVTKDVLNVVDDKMSDIERYNAIEKRVKEIVAENEKFYDKGRSYRLCSARGDRQLRRRYRQLDVAAARWRLLFPACLCFLRREIRGVLEGQCSL